MVEQTAPNVPDLWDEKMTTRKLPVITNQPMAVKILALVLLQKQRAWYEAYEEDVRYWYRAGIGRDGYRYPSCIHGTDLTTDYDNICAGCEDGYNRFDYLRDLGECLTQAKEYFNLRHDRLGGLCELIMRQAPITPELYRWADLPVSSHLEGTSWIL